MKRKPYKKSALDKMILKLFADKKASYKLLRDIVKIKQIDRRS